MAIFEFEFMRRAFVVGILLAVIIPCIGMIVVLKRLSMIGDSISHASLAGVSAGLVMGINPIVGSIIACILAALSIELIRKKLPRYGEISIAVIMSAGVGLAGVLSGFIKNSSNLNSFLFGSIVSISDFELYLVVGISLAVMAAFILLYRGLFYITMDERSAHLAGVPVNWINFIFIILTAVTVSVAARTVGALMVSSLMVIPVTCAMEFGKSYRQTLIYSIFFALFFMVSGLLASYYLGLKPGGTVVLIGVISLVGILVFSGKRNR